jgi:YVTN family beta-propeller protein
VRFRVSDAETGAPVSPLEPAVWISRTEEANKVSCRDKIGRYLQAMLSYQAEVDLNKYFILMLNNDRSISVVDPLMGVSGITQLYDMIMLDEPGEDWARSADDKRLFVTMPAAGKVAVVDLESFEVIESVEAGARPVRVAVQPDGRYLWVGNDSDKEGESGVTVIDLRTFAVAARIATGPGHHEIAFSSDSLSAFVTNPDADTLSVIDVQRLEKVADVATGRRPIAVGYSGLSQSAYVASEDGAVTVVDGRRREIVARLETGSGLTAFRLEPGGRWGFVANAEHDRVDVVDVSSGAIAHRLAVADGPHQFAFTDTYAYVRHLGTAEVVLIPLSQLSLRTTPGIQRVAFGSRAPGEYANPATADAISPTGEWTAVVTANPADLMVYYYMEGMIAPMGSYSTYGRIPRAVGVVDRSVRETERGVYAARFRVPAYGDYEVAFLIDSPFVDHCFAFRAVENPRLAAESEKHPVQLAFLNEERRVPAGRPLELRFTLTGSRTGEPLAGLEDVVVLATRPPGTWQERLRARPLQNGLYEATVPADQPGAYYVSVAVPSLGLDFTELPYISFLAVPSEPSEQGKGGS